MENKIIPCAAVVIYNEDKVLLVRHDENSANLTGVYNLPSGQIKGQETARQTAARKLFEETGLKTSAADLIEIPKLYQAEIARKDGVKKFSQIAFVCKKYTGQLRRGAAEIPEWVKISELKNYPLLPNNEQTVLDGLKYR